MPINKISVTELKMTLWGEPASKANSRRLVTNRRTGRPMFIKSDKARSFAMSCHTQLLRLKASIYPMEGDLCFTARVFYASRRPDLDESVIMDVLQGVAYLNDRQIKEKHVFWGLDKTNPRCEIYINRLLDTNPSTPELPDAS